MREIDRLMSHYGESHQDKMNVLIHTIAVPSIFFVTLGLVWSIPVPEFMAAMNVTFAHVASIAVLFYYFKLSGPMGAAMTLLILASFGLIKLLVAFDISVWMFCLGLFVVMWILQFVGHHIEGKKPSFFEDLRYLLVGPCWWWGHWFKKMNISY